MYCHPSSSSSHNWEGRMKWKDRFQSLSKKVSYTIAGIDKRIPCALRVCAIISTIRDCVSCFLSWFGIKDMQAFEKTCYKTNKNLYELLLTDVSQQGSMPGCSSPAQICNLLLSDLVSYCSSVQKNYIYFKHQDKDFVWISKAVVALIQAYLHRLHLKAWSLGKEKLMARHSWEMLSKTEWICLKKWDKTHKETRDTRTLMDIAGFVRFLWGKKCLRFY